MNKKHKVKKTPFKAISLFSGLGGDSLGLKNAGCEVIAFSELNKQFCLSHEENFPNCERIVANDGVTTDITKIEDDVWQKYEPLLDILFAGFPCQGFSAAGKKKDDDPRNTLFREFLRVARLTKPSMIIGENVKGLLSRKTASGETYINVIVREFENIGYEIKYNVINTELHNVPQKRERLIIVGILKDNRYGWKPALPPPREHIPDLTNIVKYNMSCTLKVDESILEDVPSECILTNMDDHTEYPDNNGAHPYLLSKYNPTHDKMQYNGKEFEHLFSFGKRISPNHVEIVDIRAPTKTIICSYDHQPRFFVPLRNASGYYLRVLLPDELKQIQGFPADYIVTGNTKQQVVQIGNAVPSPLIHDVVTNIIQNAT